MAEGRVIFGRLVDGRTVELEAVFGGKGFPREISTLTLTSTERGGSRIGFAETKEKRSTSRMLEGCMALTVGKQKLFLFLFLCPFLAKEKICLS